MCQNSPVDPGVNLIKKKDMLPENRAYFIRGDDGVEYGPVGLEELRDWVQENRAGLGTVVRLDEPDALWQPWQYYPELVVLLAEARVTSPVPGCPGLVIASPWRRVAAMVLDLVLNAFLFIPVFFVLALVYEPDWFIQSALASLHPQSPLPDLPFTDRMIGRMIADGMLVLYLTGFHAAHGRTPAKSILRVRVVDQNGGKPSLVKSFLRALMMVLSLALSGIPFIYAFFNPERRTFHDFVAGTYVVEA